MTDYIMLGMLYHRPLTGYDIKKEFELGIANFYKMSYGSLYPALKRLTHKAYLIMEEKPDGHRMKKYYEITETGKAVFLEWLLLPLEGHDLLIKIYFFDLLDELQQEKQFVVYEKSLTERLDTLLTMEKLFTESSHVVDLNYFELSTLYYGIAHIRNGLTWLHHIKEKKPLIDLIKQAGNFELKTFKTKE